MVIVYLCEKIIYVNIKLMKRFKISPYKNQYDYATICAEKKFKRRDLKEKEEVY